MKKQYVAILMEKIVINEEISFFKPMHVLEGRYVEELGMFVDKYGNTYSDVLESHLGLTEKQEFFGFAIDIEELLNNIKNYDKDIAIQQYLEEVKDCIYFGIVDGNGELDLIELGLEDIRCFVNENNDVLTENELGNNDGNVLENAEVCFYFEEEAIQKLLKMENIDDIKKYLSQVLDFSDNLKDELLKQPEVECENEKKNDSKLEIDTNFLPFNVSDMYKYVTSKVINQEEAVKKIIMTFAINYMAVASGKIKDLQPTRCLITGPTGVGKTLILETILEYLQNESSLKIPMVKVPTSQLTVAGYVGMNLEDILEELVSKVNVGSSILDRVNYAEKTGVVFFDEIDKKGSSSNGDVSGRGVLNSLLQFLDGSSYEISVNRLPFYFNTKYLNIFASGAFTHVNDEIKKKSIGFGDNSLASNLKKVTIDDYINRGQMPSEFMGRFHQIVNLNPLNVIDLKNILMHSISSPILVEQAKLSLLGIDLSWDETFIEEVAKKAYNLKLGARSLKTIIEESLFDLRWRALMEGGKSSIKVYKETVENPKQYQKS